MIRLHNETLVRMQSTTSIAFLAAMKVPLLLTYLLCLTRQTQCPQHCWSRQILLHCRSHQLCLLLPYRQTCCRLPLGLVNRSRSCFGTVRMGCSYCHRQIRQLQLHRRSRLLLKYYRRTESRPRCCWWYCCYWCRRIRQRLSRCCHCQTRKT